MLTRDRARVRCSSNDLPPVVSFSSMLAALFAVTVVVAAARDVAASSLLAPAVGTADTAVLGAAVAAPLTPDGALFQNPAGLVGFRRKTVSQSFGAALGFSRIGDAPGAEGKDSQVAFVPSAALSVPVRQRWRLAWGMYGSTGAVFDLTPGFFSETAVAAMPLAVAYELHPKLWLGAEVAPLFGYTRNRFPFVNPDTGTPEKVRYALRGFGIQSMGGATWKATDRLWFGLGLRTPGRIWMDGSTPFGGRRRDVDLVLRAPAQIFAGVTVRVHRRFDLSTAVRWTDASTFGDSMIRFASVAIPFVPDARDEWRIALGGTLRATDRISLHGGAAYASRMVGNRGVSPLLYDGEDIKLSAGASLRVGEWIFDLMGGYNIAAERRVSAEHALVVPGRYEIEGAIVQAGLRYEWAARH